MTNSLAAGCVTGAGLAAKQGFYVYINIIQIYRECVLDVLDLLHFHMLLIK